MFDPKTRILVVDDFVSMRKTVINTCKEIGFTDLIEAADGVEAWTQLQTSNPPVGLIISDITMPNASGIDLLNNVRKDPRFAKLPFVIVSAEGEQEYVVAAAKAGVDNYILKPFTTEAFMTKLETVYKKVTG